MSTTTTSTRTGSRTSRRTNSRTSRRTDSRTGSAFRGVRRAAWLANAVFWSAFAVLESVNHGWLAGGLALVFLILPDLTFLVALDEAPRMAKGQLPPRAVPYYNAMHRAVVPLVLMVLYTFGPFAAWPPLFAALCGWLAHISYDRAFGYGLRTEEGFQRD